MKTSSWNKKEAKNCFKNFDFITHSKSRVKHLKNIDLLQQFRFYEELNIMQVSKTFGK